MENLEDVSFVRMSHLRETGCLFALNAHCEGKDMIKLETIHQEMNNVHVLDAVHTLHFDWMFDPFDIGDPSIKESLKTLMRSRMGHEPTEEQLLAAERLFQSRIERGQPWRQ
jgi:hypothetical protein